MKILVAEDDRLTLRMLERYLGELGHEVVTAPDGLAAWERFQAERFRLVLTDWEMPGMSGFELMRAIRDAPGGEYVYVLFLTSRDARSDLVEALSQGADDFIRKPFDREELAVRVRVGERIVRLQQRLEEQSGADPLTGLLNRRGLRSRLEQQPGGLLAEDCAFVLADIDHFKRVNDERGHDVGDLVLEEIARRLEASFRASDLVCRQGGEEFLVVLCGVTPAQALASAERARLAVASQPVALPDGAPVAVTISLGVFWCPRADLADMDAGVREADAALYEAKRAGRDRVVLRQPD